MATEVSIQMTKLWSNPSYRQHMSDAHKGQKAWNKGLPMSDEMKLRISNTKMGCRGANKGKKFSVSTRARMSIATKGRILTPQHKTKIREGICNNMIEKGVAPRIDAGATELFDALNKCGLHIFHPNIHIDEIGYFVDGYDPFTHTVYEVDTKCHLPPSKKDKDMVRQNNIISHFVSIGKPLNKFIRIDVSGESPRIVDVLERGN